MRSLTVCRIKEQSPTTTTTTKTTTTAAAVAVNRKDETLLSEALTHSARPPQLS